MSYKLKEFKSKHKKVCYYCGEHIPISFVTVDHKTPLCKNGSSEDDNLVIACRHCNNEKGDMTEEEYKSFLQTKKVNISIPVPIEQIKIPYFFKLHGVREEKIEKAVKHYRNFGKFDKPIILKSFRSKLLVDGYSRFEAAKLLNIKEIPVTYLGDVS